MTETVKQLETAILNSLEAHGRGRLAHPGDEEAVIYSAVRRGDVGKLREILVFIREAPEAARALTHTSP